MADSIDLNWRTLERLLPLCIEFAEQRRDGQNVDVQDFVSRAGEALGVSDIGEYMERNFTSAVKDGVQLAFEAKNAKAIADIFAKMAKPTTELIYAYAQGGKDAASLIAELNNICFKNTDALCAALEEALNVPDEIAKVLSDQFGPLTVSIYCFAGAFKIYQTAARDAAIAKEHRLEAERLCGEAIARLKGERLQMDALVQGYMLDRLLPFGECAAAIDQAIVDDDDDGFIRANAQLWELFGRSAQYRNTSEFDELMLSDDAFRL